MNIAIASIAERSIKAELHKIQLTFIILPAACPVFSASSQNNLTLLL